MCLHGVGVGCVHVCVVPAEARRQSQSLWGWSYRQLGSENQIHVMSLYLSHQAVPK